MANDSTFVPLLVPDGSILAQIERRMRAAKALTEEIKRVNLAYGLED